MKLPEKWNVDIGGMPLWKKVLWIVAAVAAALAGGQVCLNCF